MTDKPQELDEILHIDGVRDYGVKVLKLIDVNEAKQAVLDWHNKQVEEVLDRLLEHGEDFTTFGDSGRSVAVEYIEAERIDLKGISNEHTA